MGGLMRQKNGRYREKRRIQRLLSIVLTVLMIGVYPLEAFAYEPVMGTEEEIAEYQTAAAGERITIKGVIFEVIDASANTLRVVGYTEAMDVQGPLGDDGGYEGTISYNGTTYTITEVADGAFANSSVKYMAFPPTITSFGKGILDGCSSLITVENDSTTVAFELPELEFGYVWVDRGQEYTSIMNGICVMKTQKNVYQITFNSQGGTEVANQTVMEGRCIEEPEAPEKDGYIFKGWYTSSTCTGDSFDFSTPVTRVYTLYAKWVEIKDESDFIALENGYSETVTFASKENKWYSFTPAVSGSYQMTTGSTYVRINYYGTDYTDDSPSTPGSSFSGELETGKTYYFRLYNNGTSAKTITLTFAGTSAKAIDTLDISAIPSHTYTGSAIKPAVTVKDGTTTLTQGTDYTVSYSNNTNAGTATVTIKAAGSTYYGSTTRTFTILQAAAPSSVPASAMEVSNNVKTVGEVSLAAYPNWGWQSAYNTKALVSGGTVEAVAEYTGSDKANYKQTTVTISITRLAPVVTDFSLNATQINLKGGETFTLAVDSVTPSDAVSSTVTYSSSDTKVATVGTDGVITAKATGTAVITAKLDTVSKTCTVSVTNPVSGFKLTKTNVSLSGGETVTLDVTSIVPANYDDYSVAWSSDNESVAAVKETVEGCVVTAGRTGTAHITAVINGISRSCTIEVKNPLTDFALDKTTMALKGGEIGQLNITSLVPANPDAYTVDWSSSNTDVAVVTNGKVQAMATGTAGITATVNGISKTCTVSVTNPCTAFELNASQTTLIVGNTYTLSVASTTPVKADAYSISWTSNREDVVTVSGGMLKALKEGSAIITARLTSAAGTFERTCTVTVNAATAELKGIAVEPASMNLKAGDEGVIQVKSVPEDASFGEATYSSMNTSVAEVDKTGRVTAKKSGTAVISITAGGFTKQCTVTVTNPLVSFSLNKTVTTISAGSSETLIITTTPTNPDAYTINWTSDNTGVATVDSNGKVVGVSGGTAIITAAINGIQKQCVVKVEEKAATSYTVRFMDESGHELECRENLVQGSIITLPAIAVRKGYTLQWKNKADGKLYNQGASVTVTGDMEFVVNARKILVSQIALDSTGKTIEVNESFVLGVNVKPDDAFDRSVQWSSSNTKVATVDSNGRVTGVAAGTAVVKAAAKDGSGRYAVCNVTVTEPEPEYIAVESLKITGSTKKVAPGKKITLKVNVSPANADNQQVIWQVSNKKYASVNSKGVVTTKKAGKGKKVTVTAVSAENGSIKATYKISIMKNAVKKIKLTGKTTLKKGKSTTIKAKFTPAKNISKELTWTSSNKKIATVSSKGKVTAKKKGKVKITAKAKDGSGKKATITIRVK